MADPAALPAEERRRAAYERLYASASRAGRSNPLVLRFLEHRVATLLDRLGSGRRVA